MRHPCTNVFKQALQATPGEACRHGKKKSHRGMVGEHVIAWVCKEARQACINMVSLLLTGGNSRGTQMHPHPHIRPPTQTPSTPTALHSSKTMCQPMFQKPHANLSNIIDRCQPPEAAPKELPTCKGAFWPCSCHHGDASCLHLIQAKLNLVVHSIDVDVCLHCSPKSPPAATNQTPGWEWGSSRLKGTLRASAAR